MPPLSQTLRFDTLSAPTDFKLYILPALRRARVGWTPGVTRAVARFTQFLLAVDTPFRIAQVSKLVSDITSGWAFYVERAESEEWSAIAQIYADTLLECRAQRPSVKDIQEIKMAFLDGQ